MNWVFVVAYGTMFGVVGAWLDNGNILNTAYGFATYGYIAGIIFVLILDRLREAKA